MAYRPPALRLHRLARRLVCDLPGGNVGGDHGELAVSSRHNCLANPRLKLFFCNPTMHKRGLEHIDHVLAVSI